MASALYSGFKQALLNKEMNLDTDTIKVIMVDNVQSDANTLLSDLSGHTIASAVEITNTTIASGVFDGDDVSFTTLSSTSTVKGLVIYDDTHTSDKLIAYIDITDTDLTGVTTLSITWQNTSPYIFTL
jgi:hypothetical protein